MGTPRDLAIDRFRGFVIFIMAAGDYLGGVGFVPAFLKHAPDIGFTIADTIAPCFIFAIGLTYGPSFVRRFKQNKLSAYMHYLTRYFALVGIGALFTAGGASVAGRPTEWGVLQAIGVAGLICLLFIRFNTYARIASGVALLCVYQFALDNWTLHSVLGAVQGGFFGTISWGAMLIIATAMADFRRKGLRPYIFCCAAVAASAVISIFLVPVSKNRVSLSYVLITLAISGIAFLLFDLGSRLVKKSAVFFCWWGENPLAFYILHLFILGFFTLPPAGWWYAEATVWLAAAQLIFMLGLISLVAWLLHKNKVIVKL
jgi:predicted acyltransferase